MHRALMGAGFVVTTAVGLSVGIHSSESSEPGAPVVFEKGDEGQDRSPDALPGASCDPAQTFFQNDWDGNDRDNRYGRRDWEAYDLGRYATALKDPKNAESAPASVAATDFAEGGRLVAAGIKRGKVNLIMGGGSGQMLALVKEVRKQGGNLSEILVIDHSPSNRDNIEGRAGYHPPCGTSWEELKRFVKTKTIPNQNYHAYGWFDASGKENRPKTEDVSDLGTKAGNFDLLRKPRRANGGRRKRGDIGGQDFLKS